MKPDTAFDLDERLAAGTFLVARHEAIQVRLANDARFFWLGISEIGNAYAFPVYYRGLWCL